MCMPVNDDYNNQCQLRWKRGCFKMLVICLFPKQRGHLSTMQLDLSGFWILKKMDYCFRIFQEDSSRSKLLRIPRIVSVEKKTSHNLCLNSLRFRAISAGLGGCCEIANLLPRRADLLIMDGWIWITYSFGLFVYPSPSMKTVLYD